ncbi:BatD family protein [Flavivirga sp. 57AJ16]|uniref:BatD family protein n=1 Tax=Flavivirga sp. 57AJ16 TaxID=3025307 RepID=UPI002366BBEC|nr:BatD family protein [Flavivirga sp. 57AJ16]MDD7884777.1 BatD family protein [Flavivirga sp. 57AJ16]
MNNELQIMNKKTTVFGLPSSVFFSLFFGLYSFFSFGQVTSAIDSTTIKIGEQITYHIQVETDTTSLVVFPEGQTFSPLEMIESYEVDTLKNKDKYNLIKKYGLTQFDSGTYTIPRQKIIVGDKTLFTDSLKVEVNNIVVDTTKQGLYDIKPIIEVEKNPSNWWKYVLFTLLVIGVIAFLLFWFIWRKKPLTEAEKIALLPPYDRAKLALQKLDESHYLEHSEIKEYYSELTGIIRTYLDEKVYDHSLESTTDELIKRLRLLKEGNQIDLSLETIKNIESILKRADLVKFAKSAPDKELAELDRHTIDSEIDHVKEVLPEPTEEEKLLDEKYREELERKKTRKKIVTTVAISVFLLIITLTGFSIKYGFNYVKDTIIGHDSMELLEGDWITSAYGFPPVTISTPKVLKRMDPNLPEELAQQVDMTMFGYGSLIDKFNIVVATSKYKNLGENKIDLKQSIEGNFKTLEGAGAKNIITKNEEFVTPNGAEGLKVYGNLDMPVPNSDKVEKGKYVILAFTSENVVQQVLLFWKESDVYADQIVERILNSIELKKAEE